MSMFFRFAALGVGITVAMWIIAEAQERIQVRRIMRDFDQEVRELDTHR